MTDATTAAADLTDPAKAPRVYVHEKCGASTTMAEDLVRGYLANPHGYNEWAYCQKCDGFIPRNEFRWAETGENLDDYFQRLKSAVPPPPESKVVYAAPVLLAVLGWAVGGFVLEGGWTSPVGVFAGFAFGVLLVVFRKLGLK